MFSFASPSDPPPSGSDERGGGYGLLGGGDLAGEGAPPPQDDLAPTLAAIRARVLGPLAPSGGETGDQQREIYQELQKRHQIDLNDERNLAGLEDPGLLSHMEGARRRLAAHAAAVAARPPREALREEYVGALGDFTALIARAESLHGGQREQVELAFLLPRQVAAYAEGKTPRGAERPLPAGVLADTGTQSAFAFLGKKGQALAEGYEKDTEGWLDFRNRLFVVRRRLESVCDGLLVHAEGAEEEQRLLREYVRAAGQARASRPAPAEGLEPEAPGPPPALGRSLSSVGGGGGLEPEGPGLPPLPEEDEGGGDATA